MGKRAFRFLGVMAAMTGCALGVGGAHAQLGGTLPSLPSLPGGLPPNIGPMVDGVVDPLRRGVDRVASTTAARLDDLRRAAYAQLVRDHPDAIALDPNGFPARAGEVVVDAPSEALLTAVAAQGFSVIERDDVLGVSFVRLRVPNGLPLRKALALIDRLGGEVSADQLHLPSAASVATIAGGASPEGQGIMVGVIDGGVEGAAVIRGFATGAPKPDDHGTAVASLISGRGGVRGSLPGARIASADVYGTDPAGGNATAIAKALGWLVEQRVSVATISLVGPSNPLLARVVAAAQARGLIIVAAVGNNGPASPPAYPASYPGVVAVSGVDARNRPLIEAGRASHIDYVAPAADMLAIGLGGRRMKVRGTSFAAPLVAGRIAAAYPALKPGQARSVLARVDGEAKDLGAKGHDKSHGRGMLCGECRTPVQ
ncbi:S8 family serine peptidase [Sphingomonas sp. SORGH_AS_0879]|uniref:S8 family serine peptidase n=1 Tax=Sphingomonas sp. SORGH_AS_0879 TaxID=3041790 RepID=UPI002787D0ED|nr:S8 family serine peptidase [Sphingomonas sp. SORGH_AS_0879]MDQ1230550.1 subtilisin family serine protease [Sphingomonas sp. SORGH_AS_0879]